MRRGAVVGLLAIVASLLSSGAHASTASSDFNGDGFSDLAIGVTGQAVNGHNDAGAVEVIYGTSSGLSATAPPPDQLWTRDTPGVPGRAKPNAMWGQVLAIGNFNGDAFADLAIGAPRDRVSGVEQAGSVTILYGSAVGLSSTRSQNFTQDTPGVKDAPDRFDNFGAALAAGDIDSDGDDDLAVGVNGEKVTATDQGAVNVLFGTPTGLSPTKGPGPTFLTQDTPSMEDAASEGDRFGSRLAFGDFNDDGTDDLAIGVPFESFGAQKLQGIVQVIYATASDGLDPSGSGSDEIIQQGFAGYEGSPDINDEFGRSLAVGDFNDDAVDDLAIGTDDDVGAAGNAGALEVVYGSSTATGLSAANGPGDQLISADSANVPGASNTNDRWTQSIASGDFDNDGIDDIVIGDPGDDIGAASSAGSATIIYGDPTGLFGATAPGSVLLNQDATNMSETAEATDDFGFVVGTADYDGDGSDDVSIGVPNEDVSAVNSAGVVQVVYGDPTTGLDPANTPNDQLIVQGSAGVEGAPTDSVDFGFSLATGI